MATVAGNKDIIGTQKKIRRPLSITKCLSRYLHAGHKAANLKMRPQRPIFCVVLQSISLIIPFIGKYLATEESLTCKKVPDPLLFGSSRPMLEVGNVGFFLPFFVGLHFYESCILRISDKNVLLLPCD